jgi:sigma-B regulation protein RsbU (phosphoserine phosphatase)
MKDKTDTKNFKLQLLLSAIVLLFIYKLTIYSAGSFILHTINEVILIGTVVLFILYLIEVLRTKILNPLSMVMNIGIINAILFFLIAFSDSILTGMFGSIDDRIKSPGIVFSSISFIYVLVLIVLTSFIFLMYRELYFLKQKRNVSTYFNTMVVFFILASFSTVLARFPELSYIKNTFLIISILLIIFNSMKISWIAFIVKKEKIILLVLSVVISALFIVNLINSSEGNAHDRVLSNFSPALASFFNILMIYGAIYFSILFFTTLFHIPTAEAFDRKAREVSSLQYFSTLINQVLDFNDLAETITDIARSVCNADSSWISWKEDGKNKSMACKNIGYVDSDLITAFVLNTVGDNLKQTSVVSLEKFEKRNSLNESYFYIAVAPLKTHNEIKGYLFTAKKDDLIFDDEDKKAMDTFSDYASVAIENSSLLKESIEKERLEKELDVAREIQRKILPAKDPEFEKLSVSSVFIPAFEVGGDYYDFFEVNESPDKVGTGKFNFVIADVSGKGISAAFIMAEVKGIFESLSKTIESPKEILTKANQILKRSLDRQNFVSAAYGSINFEQGILSVARAGHCPLLLLRDGVIEILRPTGIGLGLNFGSQFESTLEEVEISLKENDVIILYTDGITEAKNKEMEDFGDKYFEKILLENCNKSVEDISNEVIKEITLFTQHNTQHDDITLVILKWRQKLKTNGEKDGRIQHLSQKPG